MKMQAAPGSLGAASSTFPLENNMETNFNKSLDLVLRYEGGWSNHPADPGGATMKGVTQRVYDGYRARKKMEKRSVRNIDITELREIYKKQYWDAVDGDSLPPGLDYAMFDYAVNSGPVRAIKDLQRALGVKVDGHMGQATLAAATTRQMWLSPMTCVNKLVDIREAFLKSLSTFKVFGKGWMARTKGVRLGAAAMSNSVALPQSAPPAAAAAASKPSTEPSDEPEVEDGARERTDGKDVKVTAREGFAQQVIAAATSGGAGVIAALQGVDWRIGVALVVVTVAACTAYVLFNRKKEEDVE